VVDGNRVAGDVLTTVVKTLRVIEEVALVPLGMYVVRKDVVVQEVGSIVVVVEV